MKRELLYADIKHMREVERLKWREIADVIGLALSTVQEYYSDPTGKAARARKAKTDGSCVDCGARTAGNGSQPPERCEPCACAARKVWTRDAIIVAIHEWADEHGGIPPAATDWNATQARLDGRPPRGEQYPSANAVQHEFGSWTAGIRAAGFEAFGLGQYGRLGEDPGVKAEAVRLYLSGVSMERVAEQLGIAPQTVGVAVRAAGHNVRDPWEWRDAA